MLTASVRSQSAGVTSSAAAVGPEMPALLTSTSSPPSADYAVSNSRPTAARSPTSASTVPILGSMPLSSASANSETSQMKTRAPCSWKRVAMRRPIPAPPAVTMTRSPSTDVSMGMALPRGLRERLVEVGEDVVDGLEADREAHHVGAGAGGDLLLVGELAVCSRGGVQDQRARVAEIGEVREQLDALHQLDAGFVAALQAEGEQRSRALRQVFLCKPPIGAGSQPRVGNPRHRGMLLQEFGHLLRVLDVPLHAERQRLDPHDREEGVHRRKSGAEVAQADGVACRRVGEIAEGLVEAKAVIGGLGVGEALELVALTPIELAGVHDHAAHGVAVAGEVFGRRVDDDVGAPLDGPAEVRRSER